MWCVAVTRLPLTPPPPPPPPPAHPFPSEQVIGSPIALYNTALEPVAMEGQLVDNCFDGMVSTNPLVVWVGGVSDWIKGAVVVLSFAQSS